MIPNATEDALVHVTRPVALGDEAPMFVLRMGPSEYAVRGRSMPDDEQDAWSPAPDALQRWPKLRAFLDIDLGREFDLSASEPTGRVAARLAPSAEVFVSTAMLRGDERVRWVERDDDGDWFFAEARLGSSIDLWATSHAYHIFEVCPEVLNEAVLGLSPGESAALVEADCWDVRPR